MSYTKNLKDQENKRKRKHRRKRRCKNIEKVETSGRKRTHT